MCVDLPLQWDKDASPTTRATQYAHAYAAQPAFYGPISKGAWAAPGYPWGHPRPCISSRWEDRPNYPSGTRVRGVPALVFGGEYDVGLPESLARLATNVLVDGEYITMAAAGHPPWWYSECGPELVQRFIRTLEAGDTSCASVPAGGWWMPGSFPTTVAETPPATQTSGPAAPENMQRLATVIAWTVMDGIQHNFSVPIPSASQPSDTITSASLRGGTVISERQPEMVTLRFDDSQFTHDVSLSGTLVWTDILDGEFTVEGPGDQTTDVHLNGPFITTGSDVTVTLNMAGEPATFTVPSY